MLLRPTFIRNYPISVGNGDQIVGKKKKKDPVVRGRLIDNRGDQRENWIGSMPKGLKNGLLHADKKRRLIVRTKKNPWVGSEQSEKSGAYSTVGRCMLGNPNDDHPV